MRRDAWAPEWALLLLLAPGRMTAGVEEPARALAEGGVDWSGVLRLAYRHEAYPHVGRNIAGLAVPGVPDHVKAELQQACRWNGIRARLFQRELVRVAEVLGDAGVPMLPLKGPALADRLYGDVTRRVCVDIDVLVPRGAAAQAVSAIRAHGYHPASQLWAGASEVDLFLASDIEATFRRPGYAAAPLVDLHWDIARRWRTDTKAIDDLWSEASPTTLWGVKAYRLSPEWELLYLIAHAVRHRWQALKWLVDIHDACAVLALDWDRLAAKADRFGWGRALRLTLGLCRALLGTDVPEALAEKPPRWALAQVQGEPGGWKNALIPVRVLDRRADRLRYLLRLLLQPTILERRAVRLPAALSLAYYPLRPLRLAARWTGPIAASALKAWRST